LSHRWHRTDEARARSGECDDARRGAAYGRPLAASEIVTC
jgi:hypothetical protein